MEDIYGSLNLLMSNGYKYRIQVQAKASKNITLPMRFEAGLDNAGKLITKQIDLTTQYKTFYLDFTFNANASYKALTFYSSAWVENDNLYVKDIKVSKILTYDSTYGELYVPSKEAYTFKGWYTDKTGGTQRKSDTKVSITSNETLYAKWDENTYTIAFNANGGSGQMSNITGVKYTQSTTLTSNTFTKNGYNFAGWATSASGNVVYEDGASVSKLSKTNGATITLYAKWKANTNTKYTVNHYTKNVGSDTYALNSSEQKAGTTATKVQVSNFVKSITGFTYSNSKVATVPVTEAVISADGSLVINMYYTRNTYQVTLNKGTGISSVSGAGSYEYGASATISATASVGYTFTSWTGTYPNSSATYTFTMPAENVTNTANANANTNTKYTVNHYTKNVGTDTYTLNSSEQKTGTTATKVQVSSFAKNITGFAYSNSKVATVPVTEAIISGDGSLVINMYYTRNTYQVTLNKGVGISSVSGAGNYEYGASVTISAVVSIGYTWSSWTGTISSNNATCTFTMPNSNVTNTANANPITYTVVYNGNGATSGATANSVHTYNVAGNLTANGYARTGYTFVGWNTNAAGTGTTYSNSQSVANLTTVNGGTVTLYAIWQPNTYTVVYNGNGATSGATANSVHTYNVAGNLTANGYARTGYTFAGWNTKADGTGTTYSNSQSVANLTSVNGGVVTLYAIWKIPNIYLYNNGNLCQSITGGWKKHIYTDAEESKYDGSTGNWSYGGHFYNYLSNCLQFGDNSSEKYGNGNFYTANKINLTNYKYVDVHYKVYNVVSYSRYKSAFYYRILNSEPVNYSTIDKITVGGGSYGWTYETSNVFEATETYDISAFNGEYYIYLFSASHAYTEDMISVEVYSIYLHN